VEDEDTSRPARDEGRATTRAVVVVALLIVALVGVGSRLVALDDEPSLAVVGDSITVVSKAALDEELGPDHDVKVIAALGVTVEQMQDEAASLAADRPDQAVIELGSNDVLLDLPIDRAAAQLEQMVATFRGAGTRCVHIVDVSTRMRRNDGVWTGDRAEQLNAMTAELAATDDAIEIIGWNEAVVAAEEQGEGLVSDTVHPKGDGARVLAVLVAESLDRGCPTDDR